MTFRTIKKFRLVGILVALVLAVCPAGMVFGQVTGATLAGTVTDSTGAILAGAQVVIKNLNTGVTRNTITDKNGFYSAPNLLPGSYQLAISAPGFKTEVRRGLTLNVGGETVIDMKMTLGQVSQKVEVDERGPVLQLSSSQLSAVVNSTTVRELPLNGRSWTDLATLQPGVHKISSEFQFAGGADRGERGFGDQLSISGGKPIQNNYRLDGISVNDYANGGPGSVLGVSLGVDAIQEFSVITANYSAAYGRTSGGVINAITKSGTNNFHGSAYEFIRNSALDARNHFDFNAAGQPYKPPFKRNQFGASAGGPIVKDHTFIFGDYEGIRQSKGVATQSIVPSASARTGALSTGTVTVDPAAAKYLPLWPLPNLPTASGSDTGIYSFTAQQVLNENFFTTRVDDAISSKDSLAGTYLFDNTPESSPDNLNVVLDSHYTRRQTVALEESHIFSPTLLNSAHIGFNRVVANNNVGLNAINPLGANAALASRPGQYAARVNIAGIANFEGGLNAIDHFKHGYNSFQGYDDVFLTRGSHSFKFGVAAEYIRDNLTAIEDAAGNWSFGSLSDFLTNKPQSFDSALTGATPRNIRQTIFGMYFQDNWTVRKNLTLNLGLRYEMATVPGEAHGKFVSLRNLSDAQPRIGAQVFGNPTLHNFEPRLGLAWSPFGNSKTVVHAAFGMFDVLPLPYVVGLIEVRPAPFYKVGSLTSGLDGTFFSGAYPLLGANSLASTFIQQHPKRNYVMTWSANIQRELTPNLAVIVGYVGSRGVHQQFKVDDANMTLPTLTSAGYVFPFDPSGAPLPTLNPNFGAIRSLWWDGHSSYDALEIGVTKRMSKGLQLQGSYTWSKSLDDSSAGAGADSFGNSLSSPPWYDLRLDKSVSDFNVGRVLSFSAIWNLPTPNVASGLEKNVLGGWQLGGILSAQDGMPLTPLIGGDPLGENSTDPFAFPSRLNTPGCSNLTNPGNVNNYFKLNCFTMPQAPNMAFYTKYCNPILPYPTCTNLVGNTRRNILTGPGLVNLDFSLYKNTPVKRISDTFTTQFRAEFFNVLNHTNFQAPFDTNVIFDQSGVLQTGSAGVLDATANDSREIQFAFKVIW